MVYLLATIANDAENMPSLLYALGNELSAPPEGRPGEIWGVGYYGDGRALIIRKPAEILAARSVFELAPTVKSRIVVASADAGLGREHTPPYRFRRWLFGLTGDLRSLESLRGKIIDRLPDFVQTELGRASGGELAFGMLLAELHRGGLIDDPTAGAKALGQALTRTADTIARLSTEAESGPVQAAYVATNGKMVLVCRAGVPVAWKRQEGLEALPDGPPDPALTDFKQIAGALKRFRAVVVARHDPERRPGWTEIAENETVAIDGNLDVTAIVPG